MEIVEITKSATKKDFSVKRFIKEGDKHYAEIRPYQKTYRIRISPTDYYRGLKAYYSSKTIYCYPLEGIMADDTFEEAIYEMSIE